MLQARQEQVAAGRKSEATFGFYREKTGHWLRLLGEDFPLAQLSAADVDRYITHRRSGWSVPPRAPTLDQAGNILKAGRAGRHVTDHTIAKELVALRAALKLARRRSMWRGDPAEILPVAALGRCSAGAVSPSETGESNGHTGQQSDDVTAGKLAPHRTPI